MTCNYDYNGWKGGLLTAEQAAGPYFRGGCNWGISQRLSAPQTNIFIDIPKKVVKNFNLSARMTCVTIKMFIHLNFDTVVM